MSLDSSDVVCGPWGACPRCGSALFSGHVYTVDVYRTRIVAIDDEWEFPNPEWVRGIEEEETFLVCSRCGADLKEHELEVASEEEEKLAGSELSRLSDSVSNRWEIEDDPKAEVVKCAHCGADRFGIELARECDLASIYEIKDDCAEIFDNWLSCPWSVTCLDAWCDSCEQPLQS
ncbi:MAG: hypothetical protein WBQ14_06295 [Gaiellaceae bacterium]